MVNKNYNRGRAREYSTMRILENCGYECIRSAGSHGMFDVIAWNKSGVRFIQIKLDCKPTLAELEGLQECRSIPAGCTVELWTFKTGSKAPLIRVF